MIPKIEDLKKQNENPEVSTAEKFFSAHRERLLDAIGKAITENADNGFTTFSLKDFVEETNGKKNKSIFPSFEEDAQRFLDTMGANIPEEVRKAYEENFVRKQNNDSFTEKDYFDLTNLIRKDEELTGYSVVPAAENISIIWDKKAAFNAVKTEATKKVQKGADKIKDVFANGQDQLKDQVREMHKAAKKHYEAHKPSAPEKPTQAPTSFSDYLNDLIKATGVPDADKEKAPKSEKEAPAEEKKDEQKVTIEDLKRTLDAFLDEQRKNGKDKK